MPEGQELDLPALWMFGILGTLFGTGIIFWLIWLAQKGWSKIGPGTPPLRPWAVGWINFGIFVCGIVCLMVVLQLLVGTVLGPFINGESEQPGAWSLAVGAITMQSAFLLAYIIGRKRYPLLFRGNLSGRELFLPTAMWSALERFIRYLLIYWIVASGWMKALELSVRIGLLDDYAPQELVQIFGVGESPIALTLLALCAIIVAPIVEEIIFRGCIYRFLKSKMPTMIAMVCSGFFFALVHANLMALLPLTVIGVFLAYVYEKERNILVPICFHAFFNLLTLTMATLHSLTGVEFPH